MHTYIYAYIYIYIERERDTYIYIYIYTHTYMRALRSAASCLWPSRTSPQSGAAGRR